MASFLTKVCRSISVAKSHRIKNCGVVAVLFKRNIYGDNYLSIDDYVQHRERVAAQYHGSKDKFTSQVRQFVESSDTTTMVFTEDLKHLVHLAENKPEDVDLLVKMIKKFHSQRSELRFGNYIFGPVVMRLLHHLGQHELAYQLMKDKDLTGFFDQIISFTIAMDVLYKNKRYEQVIDLFEVAVQRHLNTKFPRDPMVLLLASCYKLNTPEALKVATRWILEAKEVDAVVLRKGVTFAAALALKQNSPNQALEILSLTTQYHYFTVKNLKIVAWAQLGRMEDVLRMLKNSVERDIPDTQKRSLDFCEETLSIVKDAIDVSQNKEHSLIFQRTDHALREIGAVSKDTLDVSLCAQILNKPLQRQDSRAVGFESKFFLPGQDRGDRPVRERQSYAMRPRHGLLDHED